MKLAVAEDRILLTEDRDFGRLAFAARADSPGVILIRFPASVRVRLPVTIRRLVTDHGPRLREAFVVLRPGSIRIRTKPPENHQAK
jgi:predicted nuclease of predicted toxin-antitoxin system